jgi:branched-chain amino acid transport system ATP-binding protein
METELSFGSWIRRRRKALDLLQKDLADRVGCSVSALQKIELDERLAQRAGTLSGGEQQMVAMARALMGRPRLSCMDEPTMGLSPLYVDRTLELIQTINRQGATFFMIEQNANLALQIADYGYVLHNGRIVLSGPARELLHNPAIRDAYLGGDQAA